MSCGPRRIVCLTEEPTEVLYALGAADRIVGISGFTVRPPQARREKPKVSAFISAHTEKILALKPDLAVGFSDLQADIARDLIRAGVEVYIANHRSVAGILDYVYRLGALVGLADAARAYQAHLAAGVDAMRAQTLNQGRRPRVYFEEWDEPQISAILWVSELIAIAGGNDVFPERACEPLGKDRIVADGAEIVAAAPDLIFASWCGKKFRPEKLAARPGFDGIPAVRAGRLHGIASAMILQPGPAALTDGLAQLRRPIRAWLDA